MIYLKKFAFAPLFFISLFITLYLFLPFIKSANLIFSLDLNILYKLIFLVLAILATALFFVIFSAISQDIKLAAPVILISAFIPFLFLSIPQAIMFAVFQIIFLLINYFNVKKTLLTYLDFRPNLLFNPHIKQLAGLLIIILSINYYLAVSSQIKLNGFQIPDSLIDAALKFTPQTNLPVQGFKDNKLAQLPSLTPEQIELLKQNPELLKQYGVDPSVLNNIPTPQATNQTAQVANQGTKLLKPLLKGQLQKIIDPYLKYLPLLLTLLLFLTLHSFISVGYLILPAIIWMIFYLLEVTKFITFTTETRLVKKMIV